ncbi:MAG: zinc metalloprotease HtpX [Ignavibacteriales bacterium]|nr:zinc metalloprotease HtpX [Ignavibacteriales bacterium]
MNMMKTVILMTAMMVLLILVGSLIGGQQGMIMAFIISLLMNFGAYWFSDKIVLMMYKAKEVTQAEAPKLFSMVTRLATQAQLPMPKVYIIPGETPNAFATGRNPENAAVAVTEGIMRSLADDELEGVLAHEFAHIKHRDILTGTIVATLVGTITFIARMAGWSMMFAGRGGDRRDSNGLSELALLIIAPIAAMMIQLAISRSREFAADEGAARMSGRPLSLANALQKLERGVERLPMQGVSPASAHMFIVNPLRAGGVMKFFSTHPPISERIERLQQIAMGSL